MKFEGNFVSLSKEQKGSRRKSGAYWTNLSVVEHVDLLMKEKEISSKEAIKEVAKLRGLPKREVYQQYHL